MGVVQATLIQRIRNLLDDDPYETYSTAIYASGGATVTVPDSGQWSDNVVGEWQDTGEQFLVRATPTGTTLTVKPGHRGTAQAGHPNGTAILQASDFSFASIADAISLTVQSLWPYVWKVVNTTIVPVAGNTWYALPAALIDFVRVSQKRGTSSDFGYFGASGSNMPISLARRVPASMALGSLAVGFPQGMFDATQTIYVDYRAKLTDTIAALAYSDIDDGILAEIVAFGAASRLMVAKESSRVSAEDATMGDATVPPAARVTQADYLHRRYVEFRNQYNAELMVTSPPMGTWRG